MANIFLDLPMPVSDGAGASIDTSAMGKSKTAVLGGSFKGATVAVQASTDGGVVFKTIGLFSSPGQMNINVAAEFMRVLVTGMSAEPFSANMNVGANDTGGLFTALDVPSVDGPGAAVDVSELGSFTTVIAGGDFVGCTLTVELSADGISFAPYHTFSERGGLENIRHVANWARVVLAGKTGNTLPFSPSVSTGAINDSSTPVVPGTAGQSFVTSLSIGSKEVHGSATPLVIGQKEFDPGDYALDNTTMAVNFKAVAANTGGVADTNVALFDSLGVQLAILNFTSATPTTQEVLVDLPGVSDIYEARIWVDLPDGEDDAIELGSAELLIINTIN